MATRFYINNAVTAPVSPTVQAAWNVTTGNTYRMMYPSKTKYCLSGSQLANTSGASGAASPRKMLAITFISQPLLAQTISSGSTISIQIRGSKNVSQTCGVIAYARLCNEDGTNITEIGNATSTDLGTGIATNRTISITLGGNVTVTDNQRIIVEFGGNFSSGVATTMTASVTTFISTTVGDLPVDNTNATSLLPWVEFSQTLLFKQVGLAV